MREPKFAAVFRRISIAPIFPDWLSTDDLQKLFCRFVLEFVPGCTEEELHEQGTRFVSNLVWAHQQCNFLKVKVKKKSFFLSS